MADSYCYLHLTRRGADWQPLLDALQTDTFPAWRQSGIEVWAVCYGLFGLASNDLAVMGAARDELPLEAFTATLPGQVDVRHGELLESTVRPVSTRPCERPGVYVFRFFDVLDQDVDEVVRLSREAWTTFENEPAYRAEPQGLFRRRSEQGDRARMLLVTWYDGMQSWQASRNPPAAARRNFERRQALTRRTIALATRLVAHAAGPGPGAADPLRP